ncbi:hypothetical protein G6F32_013399 [Rhizopus arrhizus]|nr:hypothetical protein G6F32_013399 [Rhizopus arrhizus]
MFSPQKEVPFAGHPSVGTAHAVLQAGLAAPVDGVLVQDGIAGALPLRVSGEGAQQRIAIRTPRAQLAETTEAGDPRLQAALKGWPLGALPSRGVARPQVTAAQAAPTLGWPANGSSLFGVQPGGKGLHAGVGEPIGAQHHAQRIAAAGVGGEDIELQPIHVSFPPCRSLDRTEVRRHLGVASPPLGHDREAGEKTCGRDRFARAGGGLGAVRGHQRTDRDRRRCAGQPRSRGGAGRAPRGFPGRAGPGPRGAGRAPRRAAGPAG